MDTKVLINYDIKEEQCEKDEIWYKNRVQLVGLHSIFIDDK
ncbi:hypothetical protein HMPREF0653_00750 [Prevotella disiens JCM 6334 = ATCC 29426]|uniref:Uncharacterized protein n=1 Tax=Prevotella disiens JCM 6334 = ATCC 29426 TaxID=1235811 RepID=A0ABP2Y8Z9_9BACT|nr:hypothetical protein HMPREF0653_00750 [Prevotella disiens JCM 6334 = ATCC 29426]